MIRKFYEDANIEFGKNPQDTMVYNKSGEKELKLGSSDKSALIDVLRVAMKTGKKFNDFNTDSFDVQIFSKGSVLSKVILTSDDDALTREFNIESSGGKEEFNKTFGTYAYETLLEISKKGSRLESSLPKNYEYIASQMDSKVKIQSNKGIAKTVTLSQEEQDMIKKCLKNSKDEIAIELLGKI